MFVIPIITGLIVLGALIIVILRAVDYVSQHPELVTNGTPLAYQRCQATLMQIVERYKEIEARFDAHAIILWQATSTLRYTVSAQGVEEQRAASDRTRYFLPWHDIGGVGIRMQPGFKVIDHNRDGWPDSQLTTGYTVHLLIVPISGSTMNIFIPTNERDDAVQFVAHTITLAEHNQKRINVFGFDRPPAPHKQRVGRI
jgi:hypothetical protein